SEHALIEIESVALLGDAGGPFFAVASGGFSHCHIVLRQAYIRHRGNGGYDANEASPDWCVHPRSIVLDRRGGTGRADDIEAVRRQSHLRRQWSQMCRERVEWSARR